MVVDIEPPSSHPPFQNLWIRPWLLTVLFYFFLTLCTPQTSHSNSVVSSWFSSKLDSLKAKLCDKINLRKLGKIRKTSKLDNYKLVTSFPTIKKLFSIIFFTIFSLMRPEYGEAISSFCFTIFSERIFSNCLKHLNRFCWKCEHTLL